MRVIVCGSRNWGNRELIMNTLADLAVEEDYRDPIVIVHGAARGADRIAEQEAQKLGLLVEPHPAPWEKLGKAAGPLRNEHMAALGADLCIAFWDGLSQGTGDMMRRARDHGIPVKIVGKVLDVHPPSSSEPQQD